MKTFTSKYLTIKLTEKEATELQKKFDGFNTHYNDIASKYCAGYKKVLRRK